MHLRRNFAIAALALASVAMAACGTGPIEVQATMIPTPGAVRAAPGPTLLPTPGPDSATTSPPTTPAIPDATDGEVEPAGQPAPPQSTEDEDGDSDGDGGVAGSGDAVAVRDAAGSGPAWVEISSVGIRHDVRPEGLSANGTINPAKGSVIWFTGHDRVVPGQVGTAVIAGHVDAGGRPDVFHDLPGVIPGDTVRIGYATGEVVTLRIVDTEIADKYQVARNHSIWGRNTSTRRVALITCDDALGFRDDGHRVANFVAIAEVV